MALYDGVWFMIVYLIYMHVALCPALLQTLHQRQSQCTICVDVFKMLAAVPCWIDSTDTASASMTTRFSVLLCSIQLQPCLDGLMLQTLHGHPDDERFANSIYLSASLIFITLWFATSAHASSTLCGLPNFSSLIFIIHRHCSSSSPGVTTKNGMQHHWIGQCLSLTVSSHIKYFFALQCFPLLSDFQQKLAHNFDQGRCFIEIFLKR